METPAIEVSACALEHAQLFACQRTFDAVIPVTYAFLLLGFGMGMLAMRGYYRRKHG